MTSVVTRFAPSPTGKFHVGGIRSALYNYLFARKHGGTFILRSEDTDPVRSKKEYEEYFLDVFTWLGLEHDRFERQSDRTAIYKKYLEQLIENGSAYVAKEEVKEEGQHTEVIRFKNPNKTVSFHDEALGDISFDTTELGDFIIARQLDSPLYHFVVVVDDFEMGITHIIRGQEHVSNTPRHILLQEALGAPRPIYAHASTILNNERAKLSKRDPLVRPALEYRDLGYLPGAMLNFMALLGWNPGTDQEVFTLSELIESFSLERLQKSGAVFNPEKLDWINREHMKKLSANAQFDGLRSFVPSEISDDLLHKLLPLLVERVSYFGEAKSLFEAGEFDYLSGEPAPDPDKLPWKSDGRKTAREHLSGALERLTTLSEASWSAESVKERLWEYAEEKGRGSVLWPLRMSLTGKEKSADPFTVAGLLGKETTLRRMGTAITSLS
ncbi:MAG TPA: glutamate--tRNA ligase family protein [Candidatus Paceibacterota bacterium]|nr:glutamate--tRNA ligase family protein [Candidatus Paceibacterota bacterium]